jgi:hypothetical protein
VTDGHLGQDGALEVDSGVAHAAGETGGTKSASFAAERNELGAAALPALELQEAKIQDAALQIGLELALDEAR